MTTSNELQASQVKWKRLRRFLYLTAFVTGLAVVSTYLLAGGSLILDADGFVTRCRVAVASPWPDARVRLIGVLPGDWVEAGQKVAVVESAAMSRSLADLAAEKARISSRLAQLEARRTVARALLLPASANAAQTGDFLDALQKAQAAGLVVNRSMQQMTAAKLEAMDKLLTLQGEVSSLETEVNSNQDALREVSKAYGDLQQTYGSGILTAPASGYIGSKVAIVGEVLVSGRADVANIYTGPSYVLAYIPESYLFEVEEGQKVSVRGRGQVVAGHIEKVLPVTEALPPEFQLPNRVRGRGQLVRVALSDRENFAVDEKIRLTRCYLNGCRLWYPNHQAALPGIVRFQRNLEASRDESIMKVSDTPQTLRPTAERVGLACSTQTLAITSTSSTPMPR
jgi:multidrug resistance efflux pump